MRIKRKSIAMKPVQGGISDTLNIEDKVKNAPSINLVEQMTGIPQEGVIVFDGTEEEIPEGYEKADIDWKNANVNSNYVSDGTVKYAQIGKLVIVDVTNLTISANTEQITILASGLPHGGAASMLQQFDAPNSKRVVVADGNLQTWYDPISASPNQLYGQFIYFTN